jgi:hypothetical protein
MRYLLLLTLLAGCAHENIYSTLTARDKALQCQNLVCPAAEADEGVLRGGSSSYDPLDDTCICHFRDGRFYITPRR